MRKKLIKKRAARALEVQSLEVRNLLAGVVETLSSPSSDVGSVSSVYDPSGDLSHAHDVLGLSGAGQTVAIIDSGIAYDHYALGGGFGEAYRVVGGWDFAENDADPYDDGPLGFHGTHIAGIVGSDDAEVTGVAPGADLVALRVFDDFGQSDFDWIEAALAWVHDHQDSFEYPITTVNLSVGAGLNAESIPDWTDLEDEFELLAEDGIFVAVAAGNAFQEHGIAGLNYPASSPYVVPVSSVNSAGRLSGFSQRHERALAVPGEIINSTVPDYLYGFDGVTDDFSKSSGTSMATPYLAGAGMLVQEAFARVGREDFTPSDVYDQLYAHADTIYDSITRSDYQRVNLRASLDAILGSEDEQVSENDSEDGTDDERLEVPYTEATSVTMLGQVESVLLLAATDRWFEFEAAQSGIMLATKMEAEIKVFDGDTRIDTDVQDSLLASSSSDVKFAGSQFFEVQAGRKYRIHITGSAQETSLQQLVAYDGDEIVVRGDRVDDLIVSLGSSFVISAQGSRQQVGTGGRLGSHDTVDVAQTDAGLVVRLGSTRVDVVSSTQAPNSGRIDSSEVLHSPLGADAPPTIWSTASIDVGCGLNSTDEVLLSEHATDEMFACTESVSKARAAVLTTRLLDELYSDGNVREALVETAVELPVGTTDLGEHVSVDEALSARLNQF